MALTQTELDRRREALGSTDLVRILNGDVLAVYLEKVYGSTATDLPENDPRTVGSILEAPVLDWAEQQLGKLKRKVRRGRKPIIVSCDAVTTNGEPVEAKTSGIVSYRDQSEQWGEAGSGDIPEAYLVQTHAHMLATKAGVCHVPALLAGRGFTMFKVLCNHNLVESLAEIANRFWVDCVLAKREPVPDEWDGFRAPSLEVVKSIRRQPGKRVELDIGGIQLADRWDRIRQMRLWIKKEEEDAQAMLLAKFGDAELASLGDGRALKYVDEPYERFDTKRFKTEQPDLAAEYVKESTRRVLRAVKDVKQIEVTNE